MTTFNLPSPSPLLVSPREPASTGTCPKCGEDYGDHAFEITKWPHRWLACYGCTLGWAIKELQQAQKDGNADVMEILQSVDEIAKCKDCGRFVCECR